MGAEEVNLIIKMVKRWMVGVQFSSRNNEEVDGKVEEKITINEIFCTYTNLGPL